MKLISMCTSYVSYRLIRINVHPFNCTPWLASAGFEGGMLEAASLVPFIAIDTLDLHVMNMPCCGRRNR